MKPNKDEIVVNSHTEFIRAVSDSQHNISDINKSEFPYIDLDNARSLTKGKIIEIFYYLLDIEETTKRKVIEFAQWSNLISTTLPNAKFKIELSNNILILLPKVNSTELVQIIETEQ